MRNWLMSLLAELGNPGRLDMVVGEYDSYCAFNLTLHTMTLLERVQCYLGMKRQ